LYKDYAVLNASAHQT